MALQNIYPASFREQFNTNVEFLAARSPSVFEGHGIREERQGAAFDWYDQLGGIDFADRGHTAGVLQDTTDTTPQFGRRGVACAPKFVAIGIDKEDEVKGLVSPSSKHAQNIAYALANLKDDTIITALGGNATEASNTAPPGQTFSNVALPAGQSIAVDYGSTGVNSGLTLGKLMRAFELLDSVPDADKKKKYFVFGTRQLTNLLSTVQVGSADYNSVRALVAGELNFFMGFTFIKSSRLSAASSIRSCYAYTEGAILFSTQRPAQTKIDELPGKHYATQVYCETSIGAVRMREDYVAKILCDETV